MTTISLRLSPHALPAQHDAILQGHKVLCLDCFDTLFWRATQTPADVFVSLAGQALFRQQGIDMPARMAAEHEARRRKEFSVAATNEVSIEEIYRETGVDPGLIPALVEAELSEEQRYGFIFQPVYELAAEARRRGMKVVIVSDIYYSAAQLRRLLEGTMPRLAGLIDHIHTSSDHGCGKTTGLWTVVLAAHPLAPSQLVHVGDNLQADHLAPMKLGIRAFYLDVRQPLLQAVDSQREVSASIAGRATRVDEPVLHPFKGLLAELNVDTPEKVLGCAVLGPIMLAFAQKVMAVHAAHQRQGRRCRLGFLLRDGHLISEVVRRLMPDHEDLALLNISRATSLAASIDTHEDIDRLLIQFFDAQSHEKTFKQIPLPEEVLTRLKARFKSDNTLKARAVATLLHEDKVASRLFENARAFRQRLFTHIQKRTGVSAGDTLVFVDLGYTGTAQNRLHGVLAREMGVQLEGCYLVSAYPRDDKGIRCGVVDARRTDGQLIRSILGARIAAFEMICTNDSPSTVDYDAAGEPVYSEVAYSRSQSETTRRIQAHCLAFIDLWKSRQADFVPRLDEAMNERLVAAEIARFVYFPTADEIQVLQAHEFDVNLGTDLKEKLFDLDSAVQQIKTQGITYMHGIRQNERMAAQFELRAIDACYAMASFILNRHGSNFDFGRNAYRSLAVEGFMMSPTGHEPFGLSTQCTYDGCHVLLLPLKAGRSFGLLLGRAVRLMQLISVQLVSADPALRDQPLDLARVTMDGVSGLGEGLYRLEPGSFWLFQDQLLPPQAQGVKITFRPLDAGAPPALADAAPAASADATAANA